MNDDATLVAEHERLLEFEHFNEDVAWQLGCLLRSTAEAAGQSVLIDIRIGDHSVFCSAMPGTSPANADWARRKRNLVNLLQRSSYGIGLSTAFDPMIAMALDPRDHVAAGGCFPIRVRGTGVIGTVTVSGLPQRDDHALVTNGIADLLGIDLGTSRFVISAP